MRVRFSSSRGFTLVELLVVIAIIGILVALLLPAVQMAREASRRTKCTNNLKQIALGCQGHHDVHMKFQPGFGWRQAPYTPVDLSESTWLTHLLPYVEQEPLFLKINWNPYNFGSLNAANPNIVIAGAILPYNNCPSNGAASDLVLTYYARGNYVANIGIGPLTYPANYKPESSVTILGPFAQNSKTAIADIHDGTSFTVLASELIRAKDDFRGVMHYPEGCLYSHNRTPNTTTPDDWRAMFCMPTPKTPCVGTYTAHNNRNMVISARSHHPGGVNVALCDGSVRLVNDSVNLAVWQAAGTISNAETIGSNF
jgi:prepilin-type N-terminal cleavage/methylation domain-containing protein/prepilin-type processing-associated H-X9-DG protein